MILGGILGTKYIILFRIHSLVDFHQIHWHSKISEISINLKRLVFISEFKKIFIFNINKL